VASREAAESIREVADEFVSVICPATFVSVGNWYQSFAQVADEDVRRLLDIESQQRETAGRGRSS
jgi:predicted phosphoribosyltransferase